MARLSGWRPYVVPLATFVLIVAGLTLAAFLPHRVARADNVVWIRADKAATELENYINDKQAIPDNLAVVGLKASDTKGITFHKDSNSAYTFCVTYRKTGISRPYETYEAGVLPDGPMYYPKQNADATTLVIPVAHKAGRNCQTIKPQFTEPAKQALSEAKNGHTLVCGTEVNYYVARGPILAIRMEGLLINNSSIPQSLPVIDVNAFRIPGDAGSSSYVVSTESKIFNDRCGLMKVGDLKAGDTVGVYDVVSPDKPSVSIFLKED